MKGLKKHPYFNLKSDLWVLVLDIISVNFSYFMALVLRFFLRFRFIPGSFEYLRAFQTFAPFYTVLCVIVFMLFRLYNGMWYYVGVNDMNRIIYACFCTTVIQIAGSWLFVKRMPITFYVIGSVLQFLFVVAIRFSYRLVVAERIKFRKTDAVRTMVIGSGETGRGMVRNLEADVTNAWKPVVVIGSDAGRAMNGIPIESMDNVESSLEQYKIKSIIIADPMLDEETRNKIKALADQRELELADYTGFLANLAGAVSLTSVLEASRGPVTLIVDGVEMKYDSPETAISSLTGRYIVKTIRSASIEVTKDSSGDGWLKWMKEYKEQTGEDVSFF